MNWLICFAVSFVIFICGILGALLYTKSIREHTRSVNSIHILTVATFITSTVMFLPIYNKILGADIYKYITVVLLAIHNAIRLFIVDGEFNIILDNVPSNNELFFGTYSLFAAILFVLAPILTVGVVLSFFQNLSSYWRFLHSYSKDVYIFSELNEKSIILAESINRNDRHRTIVFTDVFENNEEYSYELVEKARKIKAICFKRDIQIINFYKHSDKSRIYFFVIGENEEENVEQTIALVSKYKDRDNTYLYMFSQNVSSELFTSSIDKGKIKLHRINTVQSLINLNLYEKGIRLFDNALEQADGMRKISAVVIGMGQYGTAVIKALTWLCQMDGYEINIVAFDADNLAEEKFAAECPEFMSPKYNGTTIPGEAHYHIKIYPGVTADTSSFMELLQKCGDITYVFIALGDDANNIKTAVSVRAFFERSGHVHCPWIQTVVYRNSGHVNLNEVTNFKDQKYDIDFIGDLREIYSEEAIINSELESLALQRHLRYGSDEDSFWKYEYNYRSSIAAAIHKKIKVLCKIPGIEKEIADRSDEELWSLRRLEHRRWNAYMRTEGYSYAPVRNDLAKTHHYLVPFDKLPEEVKAKDDD